MSLLFKRHYTSAQFKNEVWKPEIDYPQMTRMLKAENNGGVDFATDLDGYRRHRGSNRWYKYDQDGLLERVNPDSVESEIRAWDIWLEDEPGFESWEKGDFVIYDFIGTCQVVKVGGVAKPSIVAQIGPYTARWRGIWPCRKSNLPPEGKVDQWDQQQLDHPSTGRHDGYKDKFLGSNKSSIDLET